MGIILCGHFDDKKSGATLKPRVAGSWWVGLRGWLTLPPEKRLKIQQFEQFHASYLYGLET